MKKVNLRLPLLFLLVMIVGMYIGTLFSRENKKNTMSFPLSFSSSSKIDEVLRAIDKKYVDEVKSDSLEDLAINALLEGLDPHSGYISAKEFKSMNESLEGNFEGIGIEFHLLNDTIFVVNAISGGPSEALGIRSGDKIVQIEGKNLVGKKVKNVDVTSNLRGPSGTKVTIGIIRHGSSKIVNYTITRAQIPLNSVDVAYMADATTGYIKVSKFAATTEEEFLNALSSLKDKGMKDLVLDLRGNGGGYLSAATALGDHFLKNKELIVYTEGRNQPRTDYYATETGEFEDGKLIVLVDEGSASASEIVAGAIQDLDRGTIIGRRTFGKGLVQDQLQFEDGSALRLTISRYFTPSGRCIQKSYTNGNTAYNEELGERLLRGELTNVDSIKQDTTRYVTKNGRTVYGGGGVKPDIFVPLDTIDFSDFYAVAVTTGSVAEYAYNYADKNKTTLKAYNTFDDFNQSFAISAKAYAQFVGSVVAKQKAKGVRGADISEKLIKLQIKALIAKQQWGDYGYFKVINQRDAALSKAMQVLRTN